MSATREQIFQTVCDIIHTDLKFSGMDVTDDLELVGGGLALDSLDLLMLVTGIEKRFGHTIATKSLNRDTMGTVGRFVDFAQSELAASKT